jgi:hypothetical protein
VEMFALCLIVLMVQRRHRQRDTKHRSKLSNVSTRQQGVKNYGKAFDARKRRLLPWQSEGTFHGQLTVADEGARPRWPIAFGWRIRIVPR